MACSIDGKTTYENDDTNWVESDDIERMDKLMIDCGVMIMGRNTYESFGDELPNDKALQVVLTNNSELLSRKIENVIFTNDNPKMIIENLIKKGFDKSILAGGAETNTAFLKENLIDEIRLIIKPLVIGKGKPLFNEIGEIKNFELVNVETLTNGSLELIYGKKIAMFSSL